MGMNQNKSPKVADKDQFTATNVGHCFYSRQIKKKQTCPKNLKFIHRNKKLKFYFAFCIFTILLFPNKWSVNILKGFLKKSLLCFLA